MIQVLFLSILFVVVCQQSTWAEILVEDVEFQGDDDFTFEGFMYLPSSTNDEQVPGVVLIHGSGPNSRIVPIPGQNGIFWNYPIPVFEEIATSLAEQGIAVLTYDKRSCSRYNECYNNSYPFLNPFEFTTVNIFLNDASAAARFLQNHQSVKSDAVVVAGHSQSGQFLPSILLDNPSLMGGIMLAGPFRPIHELLDFQVQFTLDLLNNWYGLSLEDALSTFPQVQLLIELSNNVTSIASGDFNATDVLVAGGPVSFWESWIELADTAMEDAAKIEQPLLIVNGDMDSNVPLSEAEAWAAYLDSLGATSRYTLQIFRCVTHALNCIDAPDFSTVLDPTAIQLFVDPRLPDTMAQWVKQLMNTTSGGTSSETPSSDTSLPTEAPTPSSPSCPGSEPAFGNLVSWVVLSRLVLVVLGV